MNRKKVCCGVIFTGPGGIVMVDPRLLKPCGGGCGGQKREATSILSLQPMIDEVDRASPPISDMATHPPDRQPMGDEACRASPPISDMATHGGSTPCTTISDSSSDSGYDECSNPAAVPVAN